MPPENDPGDGSDRSPPQLRDPFPPPIVFGNEEEEDGSSSDEDRDPNSPEAAGYRQLAQDPNEAPQTVPDTDEADPSARLPAEPPTVEFSPAVRAMAEADQRAHDREADEGRANVWALSNAAAEKKKADSLELDSSRVESIRKAMSKISLPDSAVPKWAKEMSEEEWAEMVKKKLNK